MKKMFLLPFQAAVVILILLGLFQGSRAIQYHLIRRRAAAEEGARRYDPHFLYNSHGGEPLFLIDPNYQQTLIFWDSFRAQAPAGLHRQEWETLHKKHSCNIIIPVIGLQSWPFDQRNRSWDFREDMRFAVQFWEAYTANLPRDHRLISVSFSSGVLPHMALAAFSSRTPDTQIFLSPLNQGLRNTTSPLEGLFQKISWLPLVIPFQPRTDLSHRAGWADILNDDQNRRYTETGMINPERNHLQEAQLRAGADFMNDKILPMITGQSITLIWGKEDLYYSQEGYQTLAETLEKNGNTISRHILNQSGHHVLEDNRAAEVWAAIKILTE